MCDSVVLLIDASVDDLNFFHKNQAANVVHDDLKKCLLTYGANVGLLLPWIDTEFAHLTHINMITAQVQPLVFMSAMWEQYTVNNGETVNNDKLRQLHQACSVIRDRCADHYSAFRKAQLTCDDEHSSYSEYSGSSTHSSESDEDNDRSGDETERSSD